MIFIKNSEPQFMLHILTRFTIHYILSPFFFLSDEQLFPLTEGAAGLQNNLLPLDQLENYSAYEIQYAGASSITVKQGI